MGPCNVCDYDEYFLFCYSNANMGAHKEQVTLQPTSHCTFYVGANLCPHNEQWNIFNLSFEVKGQIHTYFGKNNSNELSYGFTQLTTFERDRLLEFMT